MDIDAITLLAQADCTDCDGTGRVMADDWVAFGEWRRRRPTLTPDAEDDLVEQYFLVVCDYDAVPPMSTECSCDDGKATVRLTVRELLEIVFEHVDRPVLASTEIDELVDRVKKALTAAAFKSDGIADGLEVGTWLRAVQEGAEALRSLGELRARRSGGI